MNRSQLRAERKRPWSNAETDAIAAWACVWSDVIVINQIEELVREAEARSLNGDDTYPFVNALQDYITANYINSVDWEQLAIFFYDAAHGNFN